MQGSAADVIKKAMIVLEAMLEKSKLAGRMLLQVHDELVFEVPLAVVDPAKKRIQEEMASAMKLDVPLVVDVGHGDTWAKAH